MSSEERGLNDLQRQLAVATEQLVDVFGTQLEPALIERTVEETAAEFRDARVKTFIPPLTHNIAYQRLRARAAPLPEERAPRAARTS